MSTPRLYSDLAAWWPVMSAAADYEEEAGLYREAFVSHAGIPLRTVLELGSGGGNNASHLKAAFELTLVDRSIGMLDASRALNPECEHVLGDMRTVRLDRTFDAVFIHDAITYMTSEDDLLAALVTARRHVREDGVVLVVPDGTKETWRPSTHHGGHDLGDRSMRYLEWHFDPDPTDTTTRCAFSFLMREGDGPVESVFDEHILGLFPRATWLQTFEAAGLRPRPIPYEHSEFDPAIDYEMFLGFPM